MNRVPVTIRGAGQLRDELKQLKNEGRPRVVKAIAEAREHGDLKENAEYHAAREEQGFIEARIKDIEAKLSNAQVIDIKELPWTGRVVFGATVELAAEDEGTTVRYQIVGEDEADISEGLISFSSPIARALIGREEGEDVEVNAPGGTRIFQIVSVEYV